MCIDVGIIGVSRLKGISFLSFVKSKLLRMLINESINMFNIKMNFCYNIEIIYLKKLYLCFIYNYIRYFMNTV